MNKTTWIVVILCFFSGVLPAQDFSKISSSQKLTPQQMEYYKKYYGNMRPGASSNLQFNTEERTYAGDSLNLKMKDAAQNQGSKSERDKISKDNEEEKKLKVFGSDIFNRNKITFEPNLNLPTPANYLIGVNEELIVDISGLYDVSYKVKVNPEGKIRIPNAGLIKVGGMTIEKATNVIRLELSKYYTGFTTGETKLSVSIGNLRSIRVAIVGEASYPGTYTLPSLATVINALYVCGGPGEIGSMRDIKLVRDGKTISNIDFYQFLMTGTLKENMTLQDNDVIIIAPNQNRVKIDGAINRRGIFEILAGESLKDMLNYAGGFAENANRSLISVFRYSDNKRTVINIPEAYSATSLIRPGDSIYIAPIDNIYDNRVELSGAVYRPGGYAVDSTLTVGKLIEKAGGVTDNAFINMASIIRQRKNQTPEIISFNLGKILSGEGKDIHLLKNDSIKVDSVSSFMEEQFVSIAGEVLYPGEYPLTMKLTLRDLVYKAKGFTEKASTENVQLIRVIKDPERMEGGNRKSFNFSLNLDKDLNIDDDSGNILLENGDLVIVRPIEGIEPIRIASVEGELKNPGYYNIEDKNIKVSDLVKKAGGFTKFAFVGGAYLIRNEMKGSNPNSINNISSQNLKKILRSNSESDLEVAMQSKMKVSSMEEFDMLDSISNYIDEKKMKELLNSEGVVSLNLAEIMKEPGSLKDILVEDGDILFVPKKSQTIKVIGEVMYPSFVVFNNSRNFKDYITSSGGFSDNALKKNSFVLYPNGRVRGTRTFLGFKFYPNVVAGSIIIVPKKNVDPASKISITEIVTVTSSLTSMMALVYAYAFK